MPTSPFSRPAAGSIISEEEILKGGGVVADVDKAASILGGSSSGKAADSEPSKEPEVEKDFTLPAQSTEEDRKEFVRTLLAGDRFIKKYELFGGTYTVLFQTRTVEEHKKIAEYKSSTVRRTREELRMLVSTILIENAEKGTVYDGRERSVLPFAAEWDKRMSDVVYAAVMKQFRVFEDMCDEFFKHANDPDFW